MKAGVALAILFPLLGLAAEIPSAEAKNHIGQTVTVCGRVESTRYLSSSEHKHTFLNFDKPYPDHTFTAFISGENRAKFDKPEEEYLKRDVCVTGEVKNYNGRPEIEVSDSSQIRLQPK